MKLDVVVTSQSPLSDSQFHTLKLIGKNCQISYGHMYFVTDLNRNIVQYPEWLSKDQQVLVGLREQGFKFNGK